ALLTPLVWLKTASTPQKQPPANIAVLSPAPSLATRSAAGASTTFSAAMAGPWQAEAASAAAASRTLSFMQPLYQLRDDLCSHDHRRRPESEDEGAEEIGFEQAHGDCFRQMK